MANKSEKIKAANSAMQAYAKSIGQRGDDFDTNLGDLLCDLMYAAEARSIDFGAALARAREYHAIGI